MYTNAKNMSLFEEINVFFPFFLIANTNNVL